MPAPAANNHACLRHSIGFSLSLGFILPNLFAVEPVVALLLGVGLFVAARVIP